MRLTPLPTEIEQLIAHAGNWFRHAAACDGPAAATADRMGWIYLMQAIMTELDA